MHTHIHVRIYIGGWGERVLASPPQTGKSFRFVRACVRPTRGFLSYVVSAQKVSVCLRIFYLLSRGGSFLFVGLCFLLKFGFLSWLVSFTFGDLIFWFLEFLEESSWREFLKRVLEERSWREFLKRILEESSWREFLKRVLEESSLREFLKFLKRVLEESSRRKFLKRVR